MSKFLVEGFRSLDAYVPGEQPQDKKYIKLNTNESPFAPSLKARINAKKVLKKLNLYPDPECKKLTDSIANFYGVEFKNVLTSNGSDEILYFIFRAFCDTQSSVIFPDITYGFYSVFADACGVDYTAIPLNENFEINVSDYVGVNKNIFIANPNAPTGIALSVDDIELIVKSNPKNVVVIDEAYVDFGGESCIPLTKTYDNLIVVQTFSKSRSLAGARLGFCVANENIIADLKLVKYSFNPYNVNSMTSALAVAVLNDQKYTDKNCNKVIIARKYLSDELLKLGFTVLNSKSNFIFVKNEKISGEDLYLQLKNQGILVRRFTKERIKDYNRITIGTMKQMKILVKTIKKILEKNV